MSKLLSFHGSQAVKDKYLARVKAHMAADHLVRGVGWQGGIGCAVGCTLEAYDHSRYPIELGLPEWLARLEDACFEGMPLENSRTWPLRFLQAIPVGVDTEPVRNRLAIRRLTRLLGITHVAANKTVSDAIRSVLSCHERKLRGEVCAWLAVTEAASVASEELKKEEGALEPAVTSVVPSAAAAVESAAAEAWGLEQASASSAGCAVWALGLAAAAAAKNKGRKAQVKVVKVENEAWLQESEDLLELLAELKPEV